MEDRSAGIIQRAAARLKQQSAAPSGEVRRSAIPVPLELPPQAKPAPTAPVEVSRQVTIDLDRLASGGVVVPSAERSRITEEFRIIKQGVMAQAQKVARSDDRNVSGRLVLITSAGPQEGKTFVAANLALALASEKDCRALVIDCDTAHRSLTRLFGFGSEAGFGDWLLDEKTTLAQIMFRTNIDNLSVIPAGRSHASIPELLSSKRMRLLLDEMAQRYPDRYIILDSSPCLAASESAILSRLVGQTVFVVEASRTQRDEVEEALGLLRACPHIALVLNKADGSISEQFGSYSYYY